MQQRARKTQALEALTHLRPLSLTLFIDDTCPKCRKPVKLSVIEAHPTSPNLAIHNYQCIDCGPVLAKVISLEQDRPSSRA